MVRLGHGNDELVGHPIRPIMHSALAQCAPGMIMTQTGICMIRLHTLPSVSTGK